MRVTKIEVDWDKHRVCIEEVPGTPLPPADGIIGITIAGRTMIEGIEMKFTAIFMQVLLLSIIAARDAFGNVLDVTSLGAVAWSVSDESIAIIVTNADGSVTLQPTGKAGTVQVTARGDTDPNTPQGFIGMVEVTFLPGEVVAIDLGVAPVPVEQPVEQPVE